MAGGLASLGSSIVRSSALVRPYLGRFPFIESTTLPSIFHSCGFHARGVLCGMHTSCLVSPFLIVYAKWSLVFRSVETTLYWLKAAFSPLYNNNTTLYWLKTALSPLYYNDNNNTNPSHHREWLLFAAKPAQSRTRISWMPSWRSRLRRRQISTTTLKGIFWSFAYIFLYNIFYYYA